MTISIQERAEAVARAKRALKRLSAHPATSEARLGAARDQLNLVYTLSRARDMWDSVQGLEGNVLDVYGHAPYDT